MNLITNYICFWVICLLPFSLSMYSSSVFFSKCVSSLLLSRLEGTVSLFHFAVKLLLSIVRKETPLKWENQNCFALLSVFGNSWRSDLFWLRFIQLTFLVLNSGSNILSVDWDGQRTAVFLHNSWGQRILYRQRVWYTCSIYCNGLDHKQWVH